MNNHFVALLNNITPDLIYDHNYTLFNKFKYTNVGDKNYGVVDSLKFLFFTISLFNKKLFYHVLN